LFEKEKKMSHPDPLFDYDNSEDDDMDYDFAQEVEDYNDYYIEENSVDDEDNFHEDEYDGQPDEYTEWQDVYGGDDWDHGQYDEY
jgi:hypothetical protein